MRGCERGDDDDERFDPPDRNDETQKKEQVIGASQDVFEPQAHEAHRRLVPSRIKPDQSRIARKFKGAHVSRYWNESQHRYHTEAKSRKPGTYGKPRAVRSDRVLEPRVQHCLIPDDVGLLG
jgi:hypothetical protein